MLGGRVLKLDAVFNFYDMNLTIEWSAIINVNISTQLYTALIKPNSHRDQKNKTASVGVKSIIPVQLKGVLFGFSSRNLL